ncbi:MAG: vWA domain-containing protein, partial [Kofleriaceae bacterium]
MRATLAIAILAAACGPTGPHGTGNGDDDGNSGGDGGGSSHIYMDAPIDEQCGAQQENIGVVSLGDPPDLLVVLDRSGSMTAPPTTFPPVFTPKWTLMRDALVAVTTSQDQNIKFGLLEFPSDDNCSADAVAEVGIGLGSHTAFTSYFAGRSPNGNTPAHIGLGDALAYYNTIPVNPAGRYVLFATDGVPNCSGGDPNTASDAETVAAVTGLFNANIKTFVLGFGTFGLNTGVLNDAAVAGGEAKPGVTKFYEANNAADLQMALQAIAGGRSRRFARMHECHSARELGVVWVAREHGAGLGIALGEHEAMVPSARRTQRQLVIDEDTQSARDRGVVREEQSRDPHRLVGMD